MFLSSPDFMGGFNKFCGSYTVQRSSFGEIGMIAHSAMDDIYTVHSFVRFSLNSCENGQGPSIEVNVT